jgi:predicted O-methyltransferase YrrM
VTGKQLLEAARVGGRNILYGTSLASLSLIGRPREMIQYLAESLFLHRAITGRRGVPQKNVAEVLPANGPRSIRLGNLDSDQAWLWPQSLYTQDLVSLCLICQICQPRLVFEIGTFRGYTAYHFALNTPESSRIITLDLPRGATAAAQLPVTVVDQIHIRERSERDRFCFAGTPEANRITCLTGDSSTFDFTPYHGQVDFFFIDGAHSYDYVRSDTLHALKCCHPGSVIAWHDYGKASLPGLMQWLDECARRWPIYSVPGGSIAFMRVE